MTLADKLRRRSLDLTPWDGSPEWVRAQEQAERLDGQLREADAAHQAAQQRLSDARDTAERGEVLAILDGPAGNLETARAALAMAERDALETGRSASRLGAAVREHESRMTALQQSLQRAYGERWTSAYKQALAQAARKASEAATAQDELVRLWTVSSGNVNPNADVPRPFAPLQTGAAVSRWLEVVSGWESSR